MQPPGLPVDPAHSGAWSQPAAAGTCLVVDAGRTRLRAALYGGAGDGRRPAAGPSVRVVAGAGLPGVADGDGSAQPVVAALAPLLERLRLPAGPVDVVCVGMTGVLGPGPAAAAVAAAVHRLVPAERVLVTSDVVTSYCGAVGLGPGVVMAAGTGTIALAAGSLGVSRVDGWGYLLGDAGSGFEIGRRGLAAALRAHDGRGGSALLAELASRRFGHLDDVVHSVYGGANPVGAVAAFAESVAVAARRGDELAAGIWADAAAELVTTTLAAAGRACGPDERATVSWTGGLFEATDLLLEPFMGGLATRRPGLTVRPPLGTALDGGRVLAAAPPGHPLLALVHVMAASRAR